VAPQNVTAVTESINVPLPPPETAGQLPTIINIGEYFAGPVAETMDQRSLIDNICINNIEHGGAAQEVVFFGTEKTWVGQRPTYRH